MGILAHTLELRTNRVLVPLVAHGRGERDPVSRVGFERVRTRIGTVKSDAEVVDGDCCRVGSPQARESRDPQPTTTHYRRSLPHQLRRPRVSVRPFPNLSQRIAQRYDPAMVERVLARPIARPAAAACSPSPRSCLCPWRRPTPISMAALRAQEQCATSHPCVRSPQSSAIAACGWAGICHKRLEAGLSAPHGGRPPLRMGSK